MVTIDAVAGDAVNHAVGGTHVDADDPGGAFDIGLGGNLAGRRIDRHDRLAVDQPDDPAGGLCAGGDECRCGNRAGNGE